jgi:hypothetical protein
MARDSESAGNWGALARNSGKQTRVIMKIVTTLITRGTLPSPNSGIAEKIPANRHRTRAKKVNSLRLARGRRENIAQCLMAGIIAKISLVKSDI